MKKRKQTSRSNYITVPEEPPSRPSVGNVGGRYLKADDPKNRLQHKVLDLGNL